MFNKFIVHHLYFIVVNAQYT